MTHLRFASVPAGPGEILLVAYILAVLPRGLFTLSGRVAAFPVHGWFLLCYLLLSLLLLAGSWYGDRAGVNPYGDSGRDMLAYALCFLVSVSIIFRHEGPEAAARTLRHLFWICVSASAIIWVAALGAGAFGPFSPWYGGFGVRFVGLATNPNQNALLLICLPFLLLLALRHEGLSGRTRRAGILVAAVGLAAGWGTGSAALRLTWIALVPLAVLTPIVLRGGWKVSKEEREFVVAVLLAAFFVVLSSSAFLFALQGVLASLLDARGPSTGGNLFPAWGTAHTNRILLSGGAEWTDRFVLWKNAWLVIGESPFFGHGPGPLSGLNGPFGGSEAHNSLADWTMATGIIGGVALVALHICVTWRTLRAQHLDLFFALLALSMFAMAHQVLRHPLVWAILTLVAIAASPRCACARELRVGIKETT